MWYYILEVSPLAPDYQWDQWWRGEKTSSFPSSFWCARRFFLRFSTSAANLLLLVYIKPATNKGENKNLHIYIQVEKERKKSHHHHRAARFYHAKVRHRRRRQFTSVSAAIWFAAAVYFEWKMGRKEFPNRKGRHSARSQSRTMNDTTT